MILTTLLYLAREWTKWQQGLSLNWPKQILFAAAIPINFLFLRSAMPILGVYAAVTIYANIQNHFFAAPSLLHYWIDGHIWKVRSDPALRTYLQLDRP